MVPRYSNKELRHRFAWRMRSWLSFRYQEDRRLRVVDRVALLGSTISRACTAT
jgi:hypothetical protein